MYINNGNVDFVGTVISHNNATWVRALEDTPPQRPLEVIALFDSRRVGALGG